MKTIAVVTTGNTSSIDTYRCTSSLKSQGAKVVVLVSNKYASRTVMDSSVDVMDDRELLLLADENQEAAFLFCSPQTCRTDLVGVAGKALSDSPGSMVAFAGMTIYGAVDGKIGQTCTVAKYCRLFGKQRYAENDEGPAPIDVVQSLPLVASGKNVVEAMSSGPSALLKDLNLLSVKIADSGSSLVVGEPPKSWRSSAVSTYSNVQQYHFLQRSESVITQFDGWPAREPPRKLPPTIARPTVRRAEPVTVEKPVVRTKIDETTPLPVLAVVFQTHNRTAMARFVLESFVKNMKYDGRVHYVIADDRSFPGHVEALEDVLVANGVSDYHICRTDATHWGLGTSINNGLRHAFQMTDVVLTTEDDWWCKARMDMTPYVRAVMQGNVAGVRFGSMNKRFNVLLPSPYDGLQQVTGARDCSPDHRYVFNAQIMLRNKRVFDALGMYRENVDIDTVERDMMRKYNSRFKDGRDTSMMVLWPKKLERGTLDSGYFMHIGRSTAGHGYDTPKDLYYLNDKALEVRVRKDALKKRGFFKSESGEPADPTGLVAKLDSMMGREVEPTQIEVEVGRPFFRVVIPAYNVEKYIEKCIRSIARQTFTDFVVSVCNDSSTDGTLAVLEKLQEEFKWLRVTTPDHKVWNGGARNAALDQADGEYTLYIDADDYFASDDVFQAIYETIASSGAPDAIRLPYIERFNGHPDRLVKLEETDPRELASAKWPMPWCTCVRSSKVVRFPDDINAQVDVVHNLWQADKLDTIVVLDRPAVVYTNDNPNSVAHRAGANRCHASWFRAAAHILDTKYDHPWMKQAKKYVFGLWMKRLEREKDCVFNAIW